MRTIRVVTVAVLAGGIAACDGPASPCASAECAPGGGAAELAIASVTMQAAARDTETGFTVVDPDAMDVRVVIRNEGTASSASQQMVVSVGNLTGRLVNIPALPPGSEDIRVVRLDRPAAPFLSDTDTMHATAAVVGVDSDPSNNEGSTASFHLAMPALRVTTAMSSATVVVNEGTATTVTVENVSRHAALPASTLAHCMYDMGGRCTNAFNATAFGQLSLPPLAPGEKREVFTPVSVPSEASNQNRIELFSLGTCIAEGDVGTDAIPIAGVCQDVTQITVRPDYEACNPVLLEEDTPGRAVPVCKRPCEIYVYAVNVEAGRTYRVVTPDGTEDNTLRWRTRYRDAPVDGSREPGFQAAESGRLYLSTEPKFCGLTGERTVTLRVN